VFLDSEGLIHNDYVGAQTAETVQTVVDETGPLIERLRAQRRPVLILVDASKITHQDAGARRVASAALVHWSFNKIAVFGAKRYIRYVAMLIIKALGKGATMGYFETREQAVN